MRDFEVNVGDRVFFAFDKSNLDDAAQATLQKQAVWLSRYRAVTVAIQGNADERGTREYDLALGARRAAAVKEYLLSRGVRDDRLTTISFGKERPACVESNESCWPSCGFGDNECRGVAQQCGHEELSRSRHDASIDRSQ